MTIGLDFGCVLGFGSRAVVKRGATPKLQIQSEFEHASDTGRLNIEDMNSHVGSPAHLTQSGHLHLSSSSPNGRVPSKPAAKTAICHQSIYWMRPQGTVLTSQIETGPGS